MNPTTTIGKQVLFGRGLDYKSHFYWIALGGLFGFSLLFNIGFTLALTYVRGMEHCVYVLLIIGLENGSYEILSFHCLNFISLFSLFLMNKSRKLAIKIIIS